MLSYVVRCCQIMSDVVRDCLMLYMLSEVVICCQMLSYVVICCHMLSDDVIYCQMLSDVVRCCQMLKESDEESPSLCSSSSPLTCIIWKFFLQTTNMLFTCLDWCLIYNDNIYNDNSAFFFFIWWWIYLGFTLVYHPHKQWKTPDTAKLDIIHAWKKTVAIKKFLLL